MAEPSRPPALARLVQDDPRFEEVPPDPARARALLVRIADEELLSVMLQSWQAQRAGLDSLHRTAHTVAYDAARKAVDTVLLSAGVRTTRLAGHHGTVAAAEAILVPPPASRTRNVRAFGQARLVRHEDEYPRAVECSRITLRERRFQTQNLVRLVHDCQDLLGLEPSIELLPTEDRLRSWKPPGEG